MVSHRHARVPSEVEGPGAPFDSRGASNGTLAIPPGVAAPDGEIDPRWQAIIAVAEHIASNREAQRQGLDVDAGCTATPEELIVYKRSLV